MRRTLLVFYCIVGWHFAESQVPVGCPGGSNNVALSPFCSSACVLCDDQINGFIGFNDPPYTIYDVPPGFCAPEYHFIKWVSFVAGSSDLAFLFTPSGCAFGYGLQVGIYGSMDCQNFYQVANCEPNVQEGQTVQLNAYDLTPGHTYFFVIDGNAADICEFTIELIYGSTIAPDVVGTPTISGPANVCTGGYVSYTAENVSGAGYYNWTLDGAYLGSSKTMSLLMPQSGSYELCVTPGNSCYGDGIQSCTTITVEPLPTIMEEETVCEGAFPFVFDGFTFSDPGVYDYAVSTPIGLGCLQPKILTLEVDTNNVSVDIDTSICEGDIYSIGGQVFSATGQYDIQLVNNSGCDTTITLNLTVTPPPITNLGLIISNEYQIIGGQVIDAFGDFTVTLQTTEGCDSLVTGFLDLSALDSVIVDTTICSGDTLFVEMDTLTETGMYTYQIADSLVYDTFLQYNLIVLEALDTLLLDTICEGEAYTLGDSIYVDSGSYEQVFPTANGCDSIVNLQLEIIPRDTTYLDVTICDGNEYFLGNEVYTEEGIYPVLFTSMLTGCDSIVMLDITVIPITTSEIDTVICSGDFFVLGNEIYDQTGNYTIFLVDQLGCDSVVEFTLTVLPPIVVTLNDTICEGESIDIGNSTYMEAGIYTDTLTSVIGCDSIVMLNLFVLPVEVVSLDTTLCFGTPFEIGPYYFTEEVDEFLQFTGANGCDSLVNLQLHYNDEIVLENSVVQNDILGGLPDGSILIEPAGGTPPYNYLWNNGRIGNYIDFLSPGDYFVIVSDANACIAAFYFELFFGIEGGGGFFLTPPEEVSMQVRPNPFSEAVEVLFSNTSTASTEIIVYDLYGREMHHQTTEGTRVNIQPDLPAGTYWLVALQEKEVIGVEKIVCTR